MERFTEGDEEIRSMLIEGETLIHDCRIHRAIYWKAVAVLILAFIFAMFVAVELGGLLVIVGLLMIAHAILTKHFLRLTLTDKRVLARYGVLQVDVVDVPFDKIESIELERMLPGHMFGYANVVIMGTGQRFIRIPFVANPRAFRRAYNEQVLDS